MHKRIRAFSFLAFGIGTLVWTAVAAAAGEPLDAVSGGLSPADVLTLGGASIVVSILVGAIIAAWRPTAAEKDRFGPLLALLTGVVVIGAFGLAQGADLVAALLTGLLAGNGAMGVHDVVDVAIG